MKAYQFIFPLSKPMKVLTMLDGNSSSFGRDNDTYLDYVIYENSTAETDLLGPQYHRTARIVILIIMICFSLIGNFIVCWKLMPHKRRRYPKSKVLFLNLAVADLFVTLIAMTSQLVWEVMGKLWIAGDAFCKIFKFMQTFSLVSSTYMLVSIAADRHSAIVRPMSRWPSPKVLAVGAWLASLVPSVPCTAVFRVVQVSEGVAYCTSLFYTGKYPLYYRQMYMASVFLAVFIIPFMLLIGLYSGILIKIWAQSSAFSSREQTRSALPRAKIKTLKMTVVIFITFMITNVPYVVQEMILAFSPSSNLLNPNTVALFGVISASNSAFNPYIYLTFQAKDSFRTLIIKAFTYSFCCRRHPLRSSSTNDILNAQRQNSFTSGSSKTSTRIITNGCTYCTVYHPQKPVDNRIRMNTFTRKECFL